MADDPPLPDWAKNVAEEQDWFIPSSDESPQNDDVATTLQVARKLVDGIYSLQLIDGVKLTGADHDEVVRMFVRSFNTNLRELGQLLDRHGDQLAEQYQPKGVEIGKWFGRTFAELAGKIGQSVRLALLLFTDPTNAASAIGKGFEFVAVDPDAVVNKWQMIRKRLEKSFDKADLQRLNVALENEERGTVTTPPAAPSSGAKPVDDEAAKAVQYAALLVSVKSLADGSLKGIQRRVTVLLVEAGGTKAIADIATDKGVGWLAPFKGSVDGYLKGVRPKLKPLGAGVRTFDQNLRLVLQEKPTKPRRSIKKAAPPKRRQSAASLPPKRR